MRSIGRLLGVLLALVAAPARAQQAAPVDPGAVATGAGRPGRLNEGRFQAYARTRGEAVRDCYEAGLRADPQLRGRVTLRFAILETGEVAEVEVASSTLRAPEFEACLVAEVRSWRTGLRPAEPVWVEYPFAFEPVRGERR